MPYGLLGPSASFPILKMEVMRSSETSANFYQTTWRNIPEDNNLHKHGCQNLKFLSLFMNRYYSPSLSPGSLSISVGLLSLRVIVQPSRSEGTSSSERDGHRYVNIRNVRGFIFHVLSVLIYRWEIETQFHATFLP
jgi:hypothetical protein